MPRSVPPITERRLRVAPCTAPRNYTERKRAPASSVRSAPVRDFGVEVMGLEPGGRIVSSFVVPGPARGGCRHVRRAARARGAPAGAGPRRGVLRDRARLHRVQLGHDVARSDAPLPVGFLNGCDGVRVAEHEGSVRSARDPDLCVRPPTDGLVEPHALHEGDVLDQAEQGGVRGHQAQTYLVLGQSAQAIVQRRSVDVQQLVESTSEIRSPSGGLSVERVHAGNVAIRQRTKPQLSPRVGGPATSLERFVPSW